MEDSLLSQNAILVIESISLKMLFQSVWRKLRILCLMQDIFYDFLEYKKASILRIFKVLVLTRERK